MQGHSLTTAEAGRDSTYIGRDLSIDQEVEMLQAKMHNLKTYLNGRMHNLETSVSGIKMMMLVNMLCFGVSICVFFY